MFKSDCSKQCETACNGKLIKVVTEISLKKSALFTDKDNLSTTMVMFIV